MATRKKKFEEKPQIDQTGFVPGVTPPYSEEAEKAIISSMLYETNELPNIFANCKSDWFFISKNKFIYELIEQMYMEEKPIDLITVYSELKSKEENYFISHVVELSMMKDSLFSSANLPYHIKIIHQHYVARDLIRIANDVKLKGFDPTTDAFELLNYVQEQAYNLTQSIFRKQAVSFERLALENIVELSKRMDSKKGVTGVPTGFYQLDELTSGWQKQALIVIGARPAMGKTALALYFAITASKQGYPVAFFSLEMSCHELVFRLQSMEAEIEGEKIRSGRVQMDEFHQFRESSLAIKDLPLYIDDSANISVLELKAKVLRMVQEHGIKLLIIDYLQLMNAGDGFSGNREQEISSISRACKGIAKECDIPVMLLSQLNRSVETRGKGGSIPMLSDLRESGAIEQDADMVIFPHRPEYYKEELMTDGSTPSLDMAEIHISKHRNGRLGAIMVRFEKAYTRFAPYTPFRTYQATQPMPEPKTNYLPSPRLDFENQDNTKAPF